MRLGTVPAGVEGAGEPITLWSGTMLLPVALVLVLALARGLDGIAAAPVLTGSRLRAAVSACAPRVLAGAAVVVVAPAASPGRRSAPSSRPWRDPRPAVSVDQAEGAFATRALFVSPGDQGAGYRFVGREAADVVRPLPAVADADGSLADRVSAALGDASTGAGSSSPTPPPTCSPCAPASCPR